MSQSTEAFPEFGPCFEPQAAYAEENSHSSDLNKTSTVHVLQEHSKSSGEGDSFNNFNSGILFDSHTAGYQLRIREAARSHQPQAEPVEFYVWPEYPYSASEKLPLTRVPPWEKRAGSRLFCKCCGRDANLPYTWTVTEIQAWEAAHGIQRPTDLRQRFVTDFWTDYGYGLVEEECLKTAIERHAYTPEQSLQELRNGANFPLERGRGTRTLTRRHSDLEQMHWNYATPDTLAESQQSLKR